MIKSRVVKFQRKFADSFMCGNSVEVMKHFPANSVDLIVTSPPYNLKNSTGNWSKSKSKSKSKRGLWPNAAIVHGYANYIDNIPHNEYVEWQRNCITEMLRVLSEDGAIFYNHKWRVQDGLLQDRQDIVSGFPVRQIIIWSRKGGVNFNQGYFLPTYEVIYLIVKPNFRLVEKANRYGDVWEFSQDNNNRHPAPFPESLIERIISSTNAKLILDPFMGSGTVAVVAKRLDRNFIGIDLSPEYCQMAKDRLNNPRAKNRKVEINQDHLI